MTVVKLLFSGSLNAVDQYFHKYILIYSKVFKHHKTMASPSFSNDMMVIDVLPSPVLIDIDKPPRYNLGKGGLLSSNKISFKMERKHRLPVTHFNPADTVLKKNGKNSLQLTHSKSAFACKRNVQLSSPIIIDIETPEESEIKTETKRDENAEKLKNLNLPSDFFVVDQLPATNKYLKKGSHLNNARQKDPVLIELDCSDQDEAGTSTSEKAVKENNILSKDSEAKNLKEKSTKKLIKKYTIPLSDQNEAGTSASKKAISNILSENSEAKNLKGKNSISLSNQDEADTSGFKKVIRDSMILSESYIKELKEKRKNKLMEKYAMTLSDQDEAGTSTSKMATKKRSILRKKANELSIKTLKKLKENARKKLKKKSGEKLRKAIQIESDEKRKCMQTDSDDSDIMPIGEVSRSACRGFLPLDVTKDIPKFSSSIELEKSHIYIQKRNFISGQISQGKRFSNESGSDNSSNFSNSCTELDGDHNSEEDEVKCNYMPEVEIKETESGTVKKDKTDINDNATSSLVEDGEINSNEDSDHESVESINYDAVSMDTDIESDGDVIDIGNTVADYIPLSSIKINDLEYCPPISDKILNKRKNLEALRRWELTGLGNEMIRMNKNVNGSLFTLLSYNVLSQQLIYDNIFLYKNCDKKYLDWSYRWPLLQQEVRHLEPDIVAFQEVEGAHYHTYYLPWFKYLGYNCIYKKKTGTKVDGCLIAYNTKKFKVIEENSVEYHQIKGEKHLNRDNIGLIVKFTPTSFDSPFCVATTHLLFNPKRHDVRLAQMAIFLTELDRICYIKEENNVPKYCPVILTGDFNSEPYSPLLKFIKEGSLCYTNATRGSALIPSVLDVSEFCQHKSLSQGRYLQNLRGELFSLNDKRKIEESLIKISHSERKKEIPKNDARGNYGRDSGIINHSFNFKSVYYPKPARLGGERTVTTHQDHWVTVDYVLYTRILKNQKCVEGDLKLIARYGLLGKDEAEAVGPLPSDVCPSDHFPLAAQFFLKRN